MNLNQAHVVGASGTTQDAAPRARRRHRRRAAEATIRVIKATADITGALLGVQEAFTAVSEIVCAISGDE